ncbi:uncharacterized protein THITE_2107116 [Thermothielavioides terrestris NRRL 8126]|uniref:Uncharacterized protein n=1 Tax=Thermothielavioides terrestris (strain ATCC 38088 / NRRL 8126) TaxID=578455 RepID=G2QSU6_THETT|nr:uncharacterized protein THITE_2107116 [Thermothielavioides terrestris NRRL 8126]AEO62671.1 hypothetical protein THITE_2107116 [Thermothielavioides terrestris NRRL 8126]
MLRRPPRFSMFHKRDQPRRPGMHLMSMCFTEARWTNPPHREPKRASRKCCRLAKVGCLGEASSKFLRAGCAGCRVGKEDGGAGP